MSNSLLPPFQPDAMSRAQLAAVSYLARYSGHTHTLYACQLRRWFEWCETNQLDPLVGIKRAHVELYIRRIAKVAGIPRHISPHSLRHAAITNALDAGVPLRDAQILARHADPRTTERYDRARGNLDRHWVHFLTAYVAGV
jgi:site-specific recombinase XerD